MDPARDDSGLLTPPLEGASRPKFRDRLWLHALLFAMTIVSTTLVGMAHYLSFLSDFQPVTPQIALSDLIWRGCWYSGTLLAILGCHELGHYLTCRYYDVDASLPFFLPAPILLTGTLGAFIRIREPIRSKRMLFDIGIAGPIAGFLVAVPALFFGLGMSHEVMLPDPLPPHYNLGEPLLYQMASWLLWGTQPEGYTLNMHPMAFGAWWGLLATALNLFPIGQLDGGHIAYAVLGPKSSWVTLVMIGVAVVLAYFSTSWIVWTGLLIVMLVLFGRHHPRTYDEHVPLDSTRLALAGFALLILVVCFTPFPIELGSTDLLP